MENNNLEQFVRIVDGLSPEELRQACYILNGTIFTKKFIFPPVGGGLSPPPKEENKILSYASVASTEPKLEELLPEVKEEEYIPYRGKPLKVENKKVMENLVQKLKDSVPIQKETSSLPTEEKKKYYAPGANMEPKYCKACNFWDDCKNKECPYIHPEETCEKEDKCENIESGCTKFHFKFKDDKYVLYKAVPCRHKVCKFPDCTFFHTK